jgi:predicted Zn-dependent protease
MTPLRSLFDRRTPAPGVPFSREECAALTTRVLSWATGPTTVVSVESTGDGMSRLAHSEITTGRDAFTTQVTVRCTIDGRSGQVDTTRTDDAGLRMAVSQAEAMARQGPKRGVLHLVPVGGTYATPTLWYDRTGSVELGARADVARSVAARVGAAGLVGAGGLSVSATAQAVTNSAGLFVYAHGTDVRLSVSARAKDAAGSGWAGAEAFDWGTLDAAAVADMAIDRCQRSLNPVAIEPGRYTAILEPDAYGEMIYDMMLLHMGLRGAESGTTAFAKKGGGTKLGLQVFDRRLSVVSDPVDPDGPFFPFNYDGFPRPRTTWIDHGVLKTLSVGADYAEEKHLPGVIDNPVSCRLLADGPSSTVAEMIATTQRGVYVTRAGGLTFANFRTLLFTGVTRDGFWLIENGKITKPIKNFRFTESPFFFLNNLEQVGTPRLVPVSEGAEFVLPPVKVRDFNFTSLADGI